MRWILLAASLVFALATRAAADPCRNGNVVATTDTDLAALASVTCLNGSLTITETVTSLKALAALVEIKGDLSVRAAEVLSSLEGLDALKHVRGTVSIGGPKTGTPKLRDVDGLPALVEIGGDLWISGGYIFRPGASVMAPIKAVSGMKALARVGGTVHLFELDGFRGLNALVEIGGDLEIARFNVETLAGLSKLERIGKTLRFDGNRKLARIEGLRALTAIGGDVDVGCRNRNASLAETTVRGLIANVKVGGAFRFVTPAARAACEL